MSSSGSDEDQLDDQWYPEAEEVGGNGKEKGKGVAFVYGKQTIAWNALDSTSSEKKSRFSSEIETLLGQVRKIGPTSGEYLGRMYSDLSAILSRARAHPRLQPSIHKLAICVMSLFLQIAQQEKHNDPARIAPGSYAHLFICSLLQDLKLVLNRMNWCSTMSIRQQPEQRRLLTHDVISIYRNFRVAGPLLKHFVGRHDNVDYRIALSSQMQSPFQDPFIQQLLLDILDYHSYGQTASPRKQPPFETLQMMQDTLDGICCYEGGSPRRFEYGDLSFENEEASAEWRRQIETQAHDLAQNLMDNFDDSITNPNLLSTICDLGVREVCCCREELVTPFFLVIAADARNRLELDPSNDEARITLSKALCTTALVGSNDDFFDTRDMALEAAQVIRPLFDRKPEICHLQMAAAALQVANSADEGSGPATSSTSLEASLEAVQLYKLAAEADTANMELKASLARAYRTLAKRQCDVQQDANGQESYRNAISLFRDLTRYKPQQQVYKFSLADCLAEHALSVRTDQEEGHGGNPVAIMKEAIAVAESMASSWPASTSSRLHRFLDTLSSRLFELNRLDEAVEWTTKNIENIKARVELLSGPQHEDLADSYAFRARSYSCLEQWDHALADWNTCLRISEDLGPVQPIKGHAHSALAMAGIGWCEWMLGRDERVCSLFNKALDIIFITAQRNSHIRGDHLTGIYIELSGIELWQGNRELALETAKRAVKFARKSIEPVEALGSKEELRMVRETLGHALLFVAGAQYSLDRLEQAVGSVEEAIQMMEKANTLDSKRKTALVFYKRCLDALGRTDEAEEVQKKADMIPLRGYADKIGVVKVSVNNGAGRVLRPRRNDRPKPAPRPAKKRKR